MKLFKQFMVRVIFFVAVLSLGASGGYLFGGVFDSVKKAADKVKKTADKGTKKIKKTAEKGIKEVEKVGKNALKEISKLGLPTDPKKLIMLALSKMPVKEVTKLANKILDIFAGELSDIQRLTAIVLDPLDELYRPIPPLPSGLPIPIPVVGSVMNILLGLTQSTEINRSNRESFACLKAFHTLTNNKYINEEEKKLIKSFEKEEKTKGIIGKKVDLKSIANIVTSKVKEIEKPITQLSAFIQKELSIFTGPLEQIANQFRPITLAAFVPLGPIYNSVIFAFKLKENQGLFASVQDTFGNSLNPVATNKGKLASLLDLKKNPITGSVMKLLETMKAPADQTLEKFDEMFVDPLSQIPWGTHDLVITVINVMNLAGGVVDAVMGTIIEALVTVLTGGAGATVSGTISSLIKGVINVDAICDFVSQTFTWSYIRYLKNRIERLGKLAAQARADGVTFDSHAFKAEVNKILGVIAVQDKKGSKDKKGSSDKKDKKNKKDKKDKKSSTDKKEKKYNQQASPAMPKAPVASQPGGVGQPLFQVPPQQTYAQQKSQSAPVQPAPIPVSSSVHSSQAQLSPAGQYLDHADADFNGAEPDFDVSGTDGSTGAQDVDDVLDESFEDSFAL